MVERRLQDLDLRRERVYLLVPRAEQLLCLCVLLLPGPALGSELQILGFRLLEGLRLELQDVVVAGNQLVSVVRVGLRQGVVVGLELPELRYALLQLLLLGAVRLFILCIVG